MKINHITGVLLAGGKSLRMGRDKRHIALGGRTLFEWSHGVLERIFSETLVVVGHDEQEFDVKCAKVVRDIVPDRATAGGLYTGLAYAESDSVFVVACDMPFLDERLIRYMASQAAGYDVTVAKLIQGIQPLHGFYRKTCLPFLKEMVMEQELKLQHLLDKPRLKTHVLFESELIKHTQGALLSFMNLNTPADLEMAAKLRPA